MELAERAIMLETKLAELKVVGEPSKVQWTVLLTASVAGLFMAMVTLQD